MITIIIVNWNTGTLLAECLNSIVANHDGKVVSVIIVDNGSTDDSLVVVESLVDPPFLLKIVKNACNLGFAAACNQGAMLAGSEYLLFLNPDTRLFANSLSVPLGYMRMPQNADVGVVGIQLLDEFGEVARSCARFPTLGIFSAHMFAIDKLKPFRHLSMSMAEWRHDCTREVDHVIGAFFFIRRSVFCAVNGFDEKFFVYYEDLDLSLRAHQLLYRTIYLAGAQAFHVGGGASRQVKVHRLFYSLRSRLLLGFKHFRPVQAWVLLLLTILLEPLTRTLQALFRRSVSDIRNTWRAYGMLYRDLPRILCTGRAP